MAGISSWLEASTRRRLLVGVCALVAVVGAELGVVAGVRAARPGDSSSAAPVQAWDDIQSEDATSGTEVVLSTGAYSTSVYFSPGGPCLYADPYVPSIGGSPGCEPLKRLFRRESSDVTIRAYQSPEQEPQTFCGPEGECPPPECFPSRYLTAGLSTDAAVGSAYGPVYAEPFDPIFGTLGVFGVLEGEPIAWAVVQVDGEVASVRADFVGGREDRMEPVAGMAVLASPVEGPSDARRPELAAAIDTLDGDGEVISSIELRGLPTGDPVLSRPECAPRPPELPEPDGPPPADEPAARQAVIDAFTRVYTGDDPGGQSENFADVDDPTGIPEAVEQVRQNFPDAITGTNSIRVDEVRFLNPTTAAVRYTILLPDYSIPEFPYRVGRAVFVDDRWKVTGDTICHDLALGGASC